MSKRKLLGIFTFTSGFIGGLVALIILAVFVGPKFFPVVLMVPFSYSFSFPMLGGIIALAISLDFDPDKYGAKNGILLSVLSFIVFCFGYGVYILVLNSISGAPITVYLYSLFVLPFSSILFGGVIVGWALVIIGWLSGILYTMYSNKVLKNRTAAVQLGD